MIKGIIFDKDGTLFSFAASWDSWAEKVINELCAPEPHSKQALADIWGFDLRTGQFLPTSPVIAGTLEESAHLGAQVLSSYRWDEIYEILETSAQSQKMVPVTPLPTLMDDLQSLGIKLGVVTNDVIQATRNHLQSAGILEAFDFVAGADSGFTPKPAPDALIAFARHCAIDEKECVMVGDSLHDLRAGKAAGMKTIGVLSGLIPEEELAPFASLILPDISTLYEAVAQGAL